MTARRKSATKVLDAASMAAAYSTWLDGQPLAPRSRQAYHEQATTFLTWLATSGHGAEVLTREGARSVAVREYKRHLKTQRRWAPTSVNQALSAIDNFFRSLGVARPDVAREDLPQLAPRGLEEAEQRSLLRAVQRCPSARDRAIATLFLNTGIRLSELAALDLDDVAVSARKGSLVVRSGKGESYRQIPLNSACRQAVTEWEQDRTRLLADRAVRGASLGAERALWLSRTGARLTSRSIDLVLRRLAADAGIEASAHRLRHTCVTNLVRAGADLVLVAEIAGHRRLDTTRRYSLPSQADREAALEALVQG